MLLERQSCLDTISKAYTQATTGAGRIGLVSGEAGIGKTSLIEEFANSLENRSDVYWGGCEALFVARPLGPLFDIAEQLGGRLLEMLRSGADAHSIYDQFLNLIEAPDFAGAVFVFEDVHWADNATMDFIKFVGRRIKRSHCLLLVSYRDDEVGPGHPLQHVIGDLPRDLTVRVCPTALSLEAIARLGDFGVSGAETILKTTGGNPFFVQELLSGSDGGVPKTVSDTILAKASRISDQARLLLNLVSVVPGKCELALLETAFPDALALVDACAEQGLLVAENGFIKFRHELSRLAVEDAMPAGQRTRWNAHVLAGLETLAPTALARLAHHADLAGNGLAVLQYAPRAAKQSARFGAHREAVVFYRQALARADTLDDLERARLLENLAFEMYLTGNIPDAIRVRKECLQLCRSLGDDQGMARALRWLSRLHWFAGKRDKADDYAEQALAVSGQLTDNSEYAMACSNRAQLLMLSNEDESAVEWANKAIDIARAKKDQETLAHALNNLGTALRRLEPDSEPPELETSLELSLDNNFQEHAARAYTNLSSTSVSARRYDAAAKYLEAGLAYTSDRDLDSWYYYMLGWRARMYFETGDWDRASNDVTAVVSVYSGTSLIGSPALTILAQLRLRRGDPDYQGSWERAMNAVAGTRELERIAPLMATKAEHAWLSGTVMDDANRLLETCDWAERVGQNWIKGELGMWLNKLGVKKDPGGDLPRPHRCLLRDRDWSGAAHAWTELGCPYEAALALWEGDRPARRKALHILLELGAVPAAAKLSKELRALGVKNLPAIARSSTRDNPAGLTNRQLQVLDALSEGLSDAEIAARLFISPRTVGHHVSAILGKLEADSRTDAVVKARNMGIDSKN
ncbi:MAG: LuxR C-terminal-related transcriptional regulator [Xanthomonadales bacterium]|nr:LuxR C-terminal-related transcriptional regulator [Xanthomonadales bacterium]